MFSKQIGTSPSRYIRALRLQEAERLLKQGNLSVADIALSFGDGDIYSFARAFKRSIGMSPSHYRDKYVLIEQSSTDG
ncbi:helix-turn-helix transcriptional regulator [Paenibacillus sp. MER TA 81-3]|nr:helix-turn-helix transcriptional regulator [Paenibacillus sp. MER TA 81-3]